MSCEHCIQGVRHEGTLEGTYSDIAGVKCYIATPPGEHDKTKVVLYLCDAFGFELENNRLLADDFARNGFKVVIPDLFEGEPVAPTIFDDPELAAKFSWPEWIGRHSPAHNLPRVRNVISELKSEGVTRFGATGYCYGGRIVFDLVFDDEVHVAATSHPSLLSVEDLERYSSSTSVPLLINACEIDQVFSHDKQMKAKELFKDSDFKAGFSMPYFEGCTHGFAVRGDMNDPKVKAGKERAFVNTVEWLKKYL
ncbi:alpha/beta-hydrolase [Peniophora sp. CONT]|nr:alpha/beta-hydrolase [Peniophora sp. CONT]